MVPQHDGHHGHQGSTYFTTNTTNNRKRENQPTTTARDHRRETTTRHAPTHTCTHADTELGSAIAGPYPESFLSTTSKQALRSGTENNAGLPPVGLHAVARLIRRSPFSGVCAFCLLPVCPVPPLPLVPCAAPRWRRRCSSVPQSSCVLGSLTRRQASNTERKKKETKKRRERE